MRKGVPVLLAHECDADSQPENCVEFATFFWEGQTPPHLLSWGLYRQIAVAMRSG